MKSQDTISKHKDKINIVSQNDSGFMELSPNLMELEPTTTCVEEESPQLSAIEAESNLLCTSKGFLITIPSARTKQFRKSCLTREYDDVPSDCKAGNTNNLQNELGSFSVLCSGLETSVRDEVCN